MEFIKTAWDNSNAVSVQSSMMTDNSAVLLLDWLTELLRFLEPDSVLLYPCINHFLSSALIPDPVIIIFDAN